MDKNQSEIVEALRGIPGCTVAITSAVGNGFPDVVVGYRGFNFMFEIKDPMQSKQRRELTDEQVKFHGAWKGHIAKVFSISQIIEILTGWSPIPAGIYTSQEHIGDE